MDEKLRIVYITNFGNNNASGIASIVPLQIMRQSKVAQVFWYNLHPGYKIHKDPPVFYSSIKDYAFNLNMLPDSFKEPDLVVFHGVFFYKYYKISKQLVRNKVPYIIVPHGSLTISAVKQKAVKKKIAFYFIFNKFLKNAKAIQYLTEGEYSNSGDKWNKRHLIIPNGCDVPSKFKQEFSRNGLVGTFIGRKSIYFKGLDLLIQACSQNKQLLIEHNCKINIYGPDEDNSNEKLINLIRVLEVEELIYVHEGVYREDKEKVLLSSDFFILTSRTEGHPVALIEALSYGLPALVTEGTNMAKEISNARAGWGVKNDIENISSALKEVIKTKKSLKDYSENARNLAKFYEWERISEITVNQYKKLIK